MARPKVDAPRDVTLSVKVSEPDAAAIDRARGTRTRSRWLLQLINEELVAHDASRRDSRRRNAQRQHGGCPHSGLRPGAWCKSCESIVPAKTAPKGERS